MLTGKAINEQRTNITKQNSKKICEMEATALNEMTIGRENYGHKLVPNNHRFHSTRYTDTEYLSQLRFFWAKQKPKQTW